MDSVKTAPYIISRPESEGASPVDDAANGPSSVPGSTFCAGQDLSRIIQDSLSDLTEAISPVPPATGTAKPADPARRHPRRRSR